MAPIALTPENGTSGHSSSKGMHAASSKEAMDIEAKFAAHNYHPLPVVFARAKGVEVWDPVRQ
jgi:ornithine--oxo-acid transaminase